MPSRRCARLTCALAVLLACSGDDRVEPADIAVDTGVVDLTIGALDGTGADVFGQLANVALDAQGRIFAVEPQADEVRVFDDAGRHLFTIGRTGAGPGELRSPCCIGLAPDGTLWVRDGGNGRYSMYDVSADRADYVRSVRMAHGDGRRWATVTFDAGARLVDIGSRTPPGSSESRTYRLHLDSAGGVAHQLAVHAAPDDSTGVHEVEFRRGAVTGTRFMYPPFGPRELIAHAPGGGYAYALSSRYEIALFDDDGAIVRHITGDAGRPPALSVAERERAEEAITRDAQFAEISRAAVPYGVPDRKTPLRELYFDAAGNLWVELNVADGADRRADVYRADGTLIRRATWLAPVDLRWGAIRDDVAVGIARDSLGVPYVVRLRFGETASSRQAGR